MPRIAKSKYELITTERLNAQKKDILLQYNLHFHDKNVRRDQINF